MREAFISTFHRYRKLFMQIGPVYTIAGLCAASKFIEIVYYLKNIHDLSGEHVEYPQKMPS